MTCFVGDVAPPNNQHPWEQKQKKSRNAEIVIKIDYSGKDIFKPWLVCITDGRAQPRTNTEVPFRWTRR